MCWLLFIGLGWVVWWLGWFCVVVVYDWGDALCLFSLFCGFVWLCFGLFVVLWFGLICLGGGCVLMLCWFGV